MIRNIATVLCLGATLSQVGGKSNKRKQEMYGGIDPYPDIDQYDDPNINSQKDQEYRYKVDATDSNYQASQDTYMGSYEDRESIKWE